MPRDGLVGRATEQDALSQRLAQLVTGHGSVTVLAGDSGSGKTALIRAVCTAGQRADLTVLSGRCHDTSLPPLYGPWIDLLTPSDLHHGAPRPTGLTTPGRLNPGTEPAGLVDDARASLREASTRRPLLVVLEDMQWADLASCELLRQIARDTADLPLMILLSVSDDVLDTSCPLRRLLPGIERDSSAAHLTLGPLSRSDIQELLTSQVRLRPADTARLTAYLHDMTHGNALFVTELLAALREQDLLRPDGDRDVLGDLDHVGVPLRLRQVIDHRLARLPDTTRAYLASAAVIGPEVPFELWAAQCGAGEEDMLRVVEEAAAAHLIEATPDGGGFRFVHALVHRALHDSVFPLRRRVLHRRVAEALAAQPAPDPDAVARHFQDAGDARAGEWLVTAGQRAERAGAQLDAVRRYEAALAGLEQAGSTPADRAWVLLAIALLRRMDDSWLALGHAEAAFELAETAAEPTLCARALLGRGLVRCYAGRVETGLADLLDGLTAVDVLPPQPTHRFHAPAVDTLLNWGAVTYWLALVGRGEQAAALAEQRLSPAASATDPATLAAEAGACSALGYLHALQGRPVEAHLAYQRAAAGFRRAGEHRLAFIALRDQLVYVTLVYHADDPDERVRLADALRDMADRGSLVRAFVDTIDNLRYPLLQQMVLEGHWSEVKQVADALGDYGSPILRRVVAGVLGAVAHAQGDPTRAWRLVRESWPAGPMTPPGSQESYHSLDQQRLAVRLALDDHDLVAARAWLSAHDRWLAACGATHGAGASRCLWARFEQARDDHPAAVRHAEHALRLATTPRQPLVLLEAHRLLGELTGEADHFERATQLAIDCGAPYEQALSLLARAEAGLAEDEPAELAREATALLEPLQARPALARVDRLLERLAADRPVVISYPAGLTEREAEVLGLLARGLSDKEIAAALGLSPKTVGRHLEKAYRKLGAHRRTEAAVFATRHGLLADDHR